MVKEKGKQVLSLIRLLACIYVLWLHRLVKQWLRIVKWLDVSLEFLQRLDLGVWILLLQALEDREHVLADVHNWASIRLSALLRALANALLKWGKRAATFLCLNVGLRELTKDIDARVEHASGEDVSLVLAALHLHFNWFEIFTFWVHSDLCFRQIDSLLLYIVWLIPIYT